MNVPYLKAIQPQLCPQKVQWMTMEFSFFRTNSLRLINTAVVLFSVSSLTLPPPLHDQS